MSPEAQTFLISLLRVAVGSIVLGFAFTRLIHPALRAIKSNEMKKLWVYSSILSLLLYLFLRGLNLSEALKDLAIAIFVSMLFGWALSSLVVTAIKAWKQQRQALLWLCCSILAFGFYIIFWGIA